MGKFFSRSVKSFSRDEKGATMLEYAIVVGVIALVAIGGATTFGTKLSTLFTDLGTTIDTKVNTSAATQ
jgi:pilus assembly protein Flp/PilA